MAASLRRGPRTPSSYHSTAPGGIAVLCDDDLTRAQRRHVFLENVWPLSQNFMVHLNQSFQLLLGDKATQGQRAKTRGNLLLLVREGATAPQYFWLRPHVHCRHPKRPAFSSENESGAEKPRSAALRLSF